MKRVTEDNAYPLIGRTKLLKQLQQIFKNAESQSKQVHMVFVEGEAGIGKTRLVQVAANEAAKNNWLVLFGRSHSIGLAFAPIIEAFRMKLYYMDETEKKTIRAKFPYLNIFFPDLGGADPVPLANPAMERTRLFETLRLFIVYLSEKQPLIFWLDDLPLADTDTLQWLQYCVQHTYQGLIVFIATCRTSHITSSDTFLELEQYVTENRLVQKIQLEPLGIAESKELIESQLDDYMLDSTMQFIYSRTLGNPLYIVELLHTLINSNGLQFKNGCWELKSESDYLIPNRITALFENRMKELTPDELDVLTLLVASDGSLPWWILQKASKRKSVYLSSDISELIRKSLVCEEKVNEQLQYRFCHPMIQSIASARISQTVLQEAHRKLVAAWMNYDVSKATFHILAMDHPDNELKSAELLYQAGKRNLTLHSYQNAMIYLEQAERLLKHRNDADELRCNIQLTISETLAYSDRPQQALKLMDKLYHEAVEVKTKIRLKRLMTWVETGRSYERCLYHIMDGLACWDGQANNNDVFWMLNERVINDLNYGNPIAAEKSLQALHAYQNKFPTQRVALFYQVREKHVALMLEMNLSFSQPEADKMLEEAKKLDETELTYDLYCLMGYTALNQGDFSAGYQYAINSTHLVRRNGMVIHEISTRLIGMHSLFLRGDWETAFQEAEDIERFALDYDIKAGVLCTLDLKALIYVLQGKRKKGLALLEKSKKLSRQVFPQGGPAFNPRAMHVIHAIVELMDSDAELISTEEPVNIYWSNTHAMQPFLKLIEGLLLLKSGKDEAVKELLDRFEVLEQSRNYVSGVKDVLSGLLARKHGDEQTAKERLTKGLHTFEALRTPFELEIARLAWSTAVESEQANSARKKSLQQFRQMGAQACVNWVEHHMRSMGKGITNSTAAQLVDPLTNREEEILQLLAAGLSNQEIASTFGVTLGTVKNHVFNLYSKLGVKRRTQAIMRSKDLGLIE